VCGDGFATLIYGDVSERPKVPASKAGVARATEGSNPSVTASWVPGYASRDFIMWCCPSPPGRALFLMVPAVFAWCFTSALWIHRGPGRPSLWENWCCLPEG
jgi:hypothetical protein